MRKGGSPRTPDISLVKNKRGGYVVHSPANSAVEIAR